jgi:hypothetical protein
MLACVGLQEDSGTGEHPRWRGASRDEAAQANALLFGEFDEVLLLHGCDSLVVIGSSQDTANHR